MKERETFFLQYFSFFLKPSVTFQTNPLLIKIDTDSGHGFGKPTAKVVSPFILDFFLTTWISNDFHFERKCPKTVIGSNKQRKVSRTVFNCIKIATICFNISLHGSLPFHVHG